MTIDALSASNYDPSHERVALVRNELIGRNKHESVTENEFDCSVTPEILKTKTKVSLIQTVKGKRQVMVTGTPVVGRRGQ